MAFNTKGSGDCNKMWLNTCMSWFSFGSSLSCVRLCDRADVFLLSLGGFNQVQDV